MVKIVEIDIRELKDYDQLRDSVSETCIDDNVIARLKNYLGLRCKRVVVETPYRDKDYLSTYYSHYSKKFQDFSKDCYRIHVFMDDDEYAGCLLLRPTVAGTRIGTTYLDPRVLLDEKAYLMLSDFKIHVRGQDSTCTCFPWMMQETDITVCAHVALWTVLRYYGNRHSGYSDCTMGQVVDSVNEHWGRKTPSTGLTPVQVADVLKNHGFSPIIRGSEKVQNDMFLDEIIAYIESGIPIIAFIATKQHAISIMGHGSIDYTRLDEPVIEQIKDDDGIVLHSKLIDSVYIMEDNYFPYRQLSRRLPTATSDVDYHLREISYAVVPLYSRMQLVYNEVYERFVSLVRANVMDWGTLKVVRIYITSSNSLKRFYANTENIDGNLREVICGLQMPKFIWCIDISGTENYKNNLTSGKVIIDTTRSTSDKEPWLLMHDSSVVKYLDGKEIIEEEYVVTPYPSYINNLEEIN
ncbi:MAG: hypothetical protein R3Y06_09555 [Faecalibacterium sp.]